MYKSYEKQLRDFTSSMYIKSRPNFSLHVLVTTPFLLMLIAGVMLPSDGNHGLLNMKSLAFLLTSLTISFYLFAKQALDQNYLKTVGFVIAAFIFLLTWTFIGIGLRDVPAASTFDQFKIFIITICTILFSFIAVKEKLISFSFFLKTIIYANLSYSLIKIACVILHLTGTLDIFTIMDKTGLRFMSMDMGTGMIRMQTSIDILTPFLLFFVLESNPLSVKLSLTFKWIYFFISAFSIFLSFSRVLIFIGFLSIALFWFTIPLLKLFRSMIVFAILIVATIFATGIDNVETIVKQRLDSKDNTNSDLERSSQISALMQEHENYPLLGKGLGGYSEANIRDDKNLHSYEVQWVAFLMQFGIAGLFILLSALSIIAFHYLTFPLSRLNLAFLGLFMCWLFSGFTNPYLISLTSGIIYALFLLTAIHLKEQKKEKKRKN